nr:hypothetical protein [Streptomyces sp. AA0539]
MRARAAVHGAQVTEPHEQFAAHAVAVEEAKFAAAVTIALTVVVTELEAKHVAHGRLGDDRLVVLGGPAGEHVRGALEIEGGLDTRPKRGHEVETAVQSGKDQRELEASCLEIGVREHRAVVSDDVGEGVAQPHTRPRSLGRVQEFQGEVNEGVHQGCHFVVPRALLLVQGVVAEPAERTVQRPGRRRRAFALLPPREPAVQQQIVEGEGTEVVDSDPPPELVVLDEQGQETVRGSADCVDGVGPVVDITGGQLEPAVPGHLLELVDGDLVEPGVRGLAHQSAGRREGRVELHLDAVCLVDDDQIADSAREFEVPELFLVLVQRDGAVHETSRGGDPYLCVDQITSAAVARTAVPQPAQSPLRLRAS